MAVAVVLLVGVVLVVLVAALSLVVLRRLILARTMGAFACLVRTGRVGRRKGPWRRGIARYDTNALQWYATLTFGLNPSLTLERCQLRLLGRSTTAPGEHRVPDRMSVVSGRFGDQEVDIAMADPVASAFVLWLESGPPGRGVNVA